ncbi:MAG: molybdopterin-dependent oxidoreductase [Coriobacteriales bacterium]|jgi:molybdopterin-containing oxidoreductase family molybdopterin binding subunit|nr:molybdopterin-dependent oxidoreductase [Coriobacteriales bacterium]
MQDGRLQSPVLDRRSFVKAGALGATLVTAGAAGMLSFDSWLEEASAEPEEKVAYLRHQFHCLGGCCLKCTVRDGRMVLIEPNNALAPEDQKICLRGINEIQHVYSADRIQTPLKRVGERGNGEFVAITWDEALETIAAALKESQEKYGENSVFVRKSTEASAALSWYEFFPSLIHAETGGRWGLDRGQANGLVPAVGAYIPPVSKDDFAKAKTIINLGINMAESSMTWSHMLFEAKEAGAKLITVDPRFSPTASKSHQYVPIKPGTDAALILGMITAIIEKEWYDEEFMSANTSLPWLIDDRTGKIVSEEEQAVDEETGEPLTDEATNEPVMKTIPLVWDTKSKGVKRYNTEDIEPALTGSYTADGVKATPQFDVLKTQLSAYTLDWATETSGVDAEVIIGLADEYANHGPSTINFGLGGPDKYTNADVLGHSLAVVAALTGNYGKEGAWVGYYGSGATTHYAATGWWALPEEFAPGDSGTAMYDFPYEDNNVHAALTFGDAFTLESGNANAMLEWVKGLDFFAICDIYYSSAVDYADIVLPACTKFESVEEWNSVRDGNNYVSLSQKAIDPLFESKTNLEVELLLAAQWGLDQHLPQSYEELARFMLDETGGANIKGATFESLQKSQGVFRVIGSEEPILGPRDQIYPTPSTKIELYYENQLETNQAFPQYELPNEAFDANPKKEEYPLVFMQGKTRYRIHAYYSASSWFSEYYVPAVNISPKDAEARGIVTGDDVRVSNDRGTFIAQALVNNAIREGTLFMAETTYTRYYKEGFLQNVTNSARNERCYPMIYGPQIPFNDTLVEVRKASASEGGAS